jgi:sulfite oxidase
MSTSRWSRKGFVVGVSAGFVASRAGALAATMDVVNERPYDWGTPLDELGAALYTPNDVFFIRSHMGPPAHIALDSWRLTVNGLVNHPLRLTLDELKRFPRHEVPALVMCSGDGRYYYGAAYPTASHPAGAQWKTGSVGNARWAGVRVRDVLAKAGVKTSARYSTNFGLDNPLLSTTPKFIRGIELDKLMDEDTLLAYEMNGQPIPYYHGFPVRLIVPGWAGDHCVKWLTNMTLADSLTKDFWTAVGYRYPNTLGPAGKGVKPQDEHPITAINVKSIITAPLDGASVRSGSPLSISGLAWSGDGAYATRVDVSVDGGKSWQGAKLGESPGKYSWRTFTFAFTPQTSGTLRIMARATDNRGATQPTTSPWNPGGYLWNGIHQIALKVTSA